MRTRSLFPLLLTALYAPSSQAQSATILSIPFYGYDTFPIAASVISADNTATTLSLSCPSEEECGLAPLQTLIYGPNTYHMDIAIPGGEFTGTQDCVSATICVESASGSGANSPGVSTVTYEREEIETLGVSITAGGEKLAAAGSAGATVMATTTSGMGGGVTTSPTVTGTTAQTSLMSAAGGSTSPSSTGAAPGAVATSRGMVEGLGVLAAVVGFVGGLV